MCNTAITLPNITELYGSPADAQFGKHGRIFFKTNNGNDCFVCFVVRLQVEVNR